MSETRIDFSKATADVKHMVYIGILPDIEAVMDQAEEARRKGWFALAFALDNAGEDMGMHGDDRVTCWTHETWATDDHCDTH